MAKVKENPDREFVNDIKKQLKANNNHCPCKLQKTPDTKCMCKKFREQENGWCDCGLYFKP